MINEFREFIVKGNVIDLAVAFVMGAAFTAIVQSLVNDIVMPLVGVLLGGLDFTTVSIVVGEATVAYGLFLQALVNFVVIGVVLFSVVKFANRARELSQKRTEEVQAALSELVVLEEIRDLLRRKV
jgi:large conductance mechanosensitive channel